MVEMLRIRDFVETREGLFFASVSYHHPPDRWLSFLRYYPSSSGERERSGRRYGKVPSTHESYEILRKRYPKYLFPPGQEGAPLQAVPRERVLQIHRPEERLEALLSDPKDALEEDARTLSEILSTIPTRRKGVTGSLLIGLHLPETSDLDFVVYGADRHREARALLIEALEEGPVRPLNRVEWLRAYQKRFPGAAELTFEEFCRYEKRKGHRGVLNGRVFDLLMVRDEEEIQEARPVEWTVPLGPARLSCVVTEAVYAFDSPALYRVEAPRQVREVVSYTHTYAGQAVEGERIEVSGRLERVLRGGEEYLRVVVGTTREAEGEYIKVQDKRG
jgi:hypothetical protein